MTVTKAWTCPSCGGTVATPYCPACGERPPNARDLTLRGLVYQILVAFSDIDGRLLRSVRLLLSRPGMLTVAYVRGQRAQHIGPLQLFLLANVLFFAAQSLTKTNIAGAMLESHLHSQDWSDLAQSLVADRLQIRHMTLDLYEPIFNRAIVLNAKSLIILMVLPFACLLPIVLHRRRQPFVANLVFSLHLYAFLLLLFCACLAVAAVDLMFGGAGLSSARMDRILSLANLAACATYLYVAIGTVYGARGVLRVVQALALALAVAGIWMGYRFGLFLITLYGT